MNFWDISTPLKFSKKRQMHFAVCWRFKSRCVIGPYFVTKTFPINGDHDYKHFWSEFDWFLTGWCYVPHNSWRKRVFCMNDLEAYSSHEVVEWNLNLLGGVFLLLNNIYSVYTNNPQTVEAFKTTITHVIFC